jgi:recombinational DNA repair protein RecR
MYTLDKIKQILKEKEELLIIVEKHTRECDMEFIRDYASAYTILNTEVELLRDIIKGE